MFPLVVNTYPENGSDSVKLVDDNIITVTFDGELDTTTITPENIKLENYSRPQQLMTINPVPGGSLDTINITVITSYEGLNEYRLIINGLKSKAGEYMFGTFQLRFSTVAGAIVDTGTGSPDASQFFEVTRTSPKESSVVTPTGIKILCTKNIADTPENKAGIMLINDTSIEDIEDALFIGTNLITDVTSISISGKVIEITPPALVSGTKYSVIVANIISDVESGSEPIIPYMFSFSTMFSPMYTSYDSIISMHMVKTLAQDRDRSEIAKLVHLNSKLAEFIAQLAENTEIDWDDPPMYVGEYVKYKTQYDILFDTIAILSSSSTTKQLKDFMVDYRFSLNDLMNLAKQVKLQYQYWEDLLKGHKNRGNAKPVPFIKGESVDEAPDFMDRKFKLMDGTKEW